MGLFEFALLFSAVVALYNFQQIKIALKNRGHPVDMLSGWMRDYRQFKTLIEEESDQKRKIEYQKNLNGLHFSLLGMAVFAVLLLRRLT
jgi:hypothetical protein